ncbi:hypothetical protein, partial [Armatimonas sp.]|uniref:hypothetical protein n=1 Tax=Armatimonas sp. TaxID=1872638 RepID=UPI00286C9260
MNTITWRWTEEDWKVWYRSYVEGATYRDQCRQVKTIGAVAGVIFGLIIGMRMLTSWLELLGVLLVLGGLGFVVASVYLKVYMHRTINQQIREGLLQYPVTESYTMTLEQEGIRVRLTGSQHLNEWNTLEHLEKIHGEFLWFRIQGQDWYLPPSAFYDA